MLRLASVASVAEADSSRISGINVVLIGIASFDAIMMVFDCCLLFLCPLLFLSIVMKSQVK